MKNVQIPYELFVSLLRHELYAKYKTASTQEEREKARREYLEKRGVPDSFRW